MSRRIRCRRKSDFELPLQVEFDYLRVIVNGKQKINPQTGQDVIVPKFEHGLLFQLPHGMELRPCQLTNQQINRCHVVGVDDEW